MVSAPFLAKNALSEVIDTVYINEVQMVKGELVTLKVYTLTRLSITDPDIVDIVDADDNEILLVAQSVGITTLFVWDENGKRPIVINVTAEDLEYIKKRIQKLLDSARITKIDLDINKKEGRIIVSGYIPEHREDHLDQILTPFDDHIINLAKLEEIDDLLEINMQVTELNTTLTKSLGFDWSTGADSRIILKYAETLPSLDGSVSDYFKIGDFRRTTPLLSVINALLEEGKGRVLSKPKLLVSSGEQATFLVGGEVPVRTTTTSEGVTSANVAYKEYGVSMSITPTIIKEKIDISMSVEISDIDAANAVGDDVAFVTRSAQTHLFLDDGQTTIMAGLIRELRSESIKKVPFLGNVPVVGALFRSKSMPTPETDTEIVISLTPRILHKYRNDLSTEKEDNNEQSDDNAKTSMMGNESSQSQRLATPTIKDVAPYYSGIPREMTAYVRSIQKQISKGVVYPEEALRYGWEGTVKVGMLILNDGTLAFALVKESSGRNIFDDIALETAKNSAPFSSFPANSDLQELNVTIPIVYSLQKN